MATETDRGKAIAEKVVSDIVPIRYNEIGRTVPRTMTLLIELSRMKFTARMGIAVGWLWGAAVWAQLPVLAPVDDEKTVRRHIAWLISEQFGLDQERSDKLDAVLSAEPIPLVEKGVAIRSGGSIPVRILDQAVTSRNGLLALVDVLSREQLEVLFVSIQARKNRADQAAINRIIAVLDSILSLSTEQREQVNTILRNEIYVKSVFLLSERIVMLAQLTSQINRPHFGGPTDPDFLGRSLTKPQRRVWFLVQEICGMRPHLMERLSDESSLRDHTNQLRIGFITEFQRIRSGRGNLKDIDPGEIDGLPFIQRGIWQALSQGADYDDLLRTLMSEDPGAIGDMFFGEKGEDRNPVEKFVMAVMEAHAESFGELDEAAVKRLTLAGRGTFQQMLSEEKTKAARSPEKQDDREPKRVFPVPRRGEERKIENLPEYTRSLWERILRGVADFPLYRRTVEEVLSQEAYAEYLAIRRERANFQLNAKRQAVLAQLDLRVLLSRKQRDHAEAWLAQSDTNLSISELYRQMTEELDRELFTDWQRSHWR